MRKTRAYGFFGREKKRQNKKGGRGRYVIVTAERKRQIHELARNIDLVNEDAP